jgi:hypothetical protein
MDDGYSHRAALDWKRARRKALVQDVLALIQRRPMDLLPFDEVREKLRLRNRRYLGLQDVPLDEIVGSVGRYQDFTRKFLPRQDALEGRWQKVDQIANVGGGMPPIELFKVGDAYFVRDGNHRVSIARAQNAPSIEAFVWEYETGVPLGPETDLDDLLIKAEYVEFLERTGLDQNRLEQPIEFTAAGRYSELEYQIALYRYNLSQIDGEEFSFPQAAALWYDMLYTPIVQIIRDSNALHEFPGRTEADLYVWIFRYQRELSGQYGRQVPMSEAASDFAEKFSEQPLKKAARQIRRAITGAQPASEGSLDLPPGPANGPDDKMA